MAEIITTGFEILAGITSLFVMIWVLGFDV